MPLPMAMREWRLAGGSFLIWVYQPWSSSRKSCMAVMRAATRARISFKVSKRIGAAASGPSPIELHPLSETLDLRDRVLVMSFQTVSSWRSSASNSAGGL